MCLVSIGRDDKVNLAERGQTVCWKRKAKTERTKQMKKLMIAAALIAAATGAQALTPYVYRMEMKIVTSKAQECEVSPAWSAACELGDPGTNSLVRVKDTYNIRGFLYCCYDACDHLVQIGNKRPSSYTMNLRAPTQYGEIFWDVTHHATIVPQDGSMWNAGTIAPVKFRFMNAVGATLEQAETVFDFTGRALFRSASTNDYFHAFNMVGSGFGDYSNVTNKLGMWKAWPRLSGNMAGTMSAPYFMTKGANTYIVTEPAQQAYGRACTSPVCDSTGAPTDDTAAYGTWTIALDKTLSSLYGSKYADALTPYIPNWFIH